MKTVSLTSIHTVRFVEKDGLVTDIRFISKNAARHVCHLMNGESGRHGIPSNVKAVFVLPFNWINSLEQRAVQC